MTGPTAADRARAYELLPSCACGGADEAEPIAQALAAERRRVVSELREFGDDLQGITGARWIADALTSTLDRIMEGDAP